MQRVASILPSVLRQRGLDQAFVTGFVVLKAQEWINEAMKTHAPSLQVHSYADGVLLIDAKHSIALQEMVMRTDDIQDWLNKEIPSLKVATVKVVRR